MEDETFCIYFFFFSKILNLWYPLSSYISLYFPLFAEKADSILKVTIVRRLTKPFLSDGVVMEYYLNRSPFRLPSGKKK